MILIIRQVVKVDFILRMGLISFLTGMILTSCNQAIKPELTGRSPANDTFFLLEAHAFSRFEKELAKIASLKASDQRIRILSEKMALFQQRTEQMWDSISKIKNIPLSEDLSPSQRKELNNLSRLQKPDQDFSLQMEKHLRSNIKHLETVSKQSEDNDISTLAITLIPDLQAQLDSLIAVNQKVTMKIRN